MFLIITKDNKRYIVEKVKHKGEGIVFENNYEIVYVENKNIKEIDANFKTTNAKTYISK